MKIEQYDRSDETLYNDDATGSAPYRALSFHDTGDAYNGCMGTDEPIILVVESEGVVGVSWAWPFAVTAVRGELHGWSCDPRGLGPDDSPPEPKYIEATEQAIGLAKSMGLELADWAR